MHTDTYKHLQTQAERAEQKNYANSWSYAKPLKREAYAQNSSA